MESYIIRIYRRDVDGKTIAGIVEVVGAKVKEEKPFKTHDELLAILSAAKSGSNFVWETKEEIPASD